MRPSTGRMRELARITLALAAGAALLVIALRREASPVAVMALAGLVLALLSRPGKSYRR
jgi:hypothetical protein